MDFIKPLYLWSTLAVAIPILIHLWHQKKGQVIAWAATQWLTEKEQQQHRGLQFENMLLLLVRCLVLLVLALLMSQPLLKWLPNQQAIETIHIVQPTAFLVDNFRFELDEARKKGEKLYWANRATEPVENSSQLPSQQGFSPVTLQASINAVRQQNTGQHTVDLHLYLVNNQFLAEVPFILVPARYHLHLVVDSLARQTRSFMATSTNKKLFVNQANKLISSPTLDPAVRYNPSAARSGKLAVLVDYHHKAEHQAVTAALQALAEVYALDLVVDNQPVGNKQYDWVLTDQRVANPLPKTLYIVSGTPDLSTTRNVRYIHEPLTSQTADRVRNGQLPEWLGELFVQHFGLNPVIYPLTKQQLSGLFIPFTPKEGREQEQIQRYFVLLFVVLTGLERWLALRKNA